MAKIPPTAGSVQTAPSPNIQGRPVTAQNTPDMTVKVSPGFANLNGKPGYWPDTNTLSLETASGVYSRIDTIVLRRDNTNRQISLEVVTGVASASPQPTAPQRTSDIFELVLAQILVGVGVTEITAANITDTRTDSTICGYVTATVDQMDFDQFKTQFDGWVADFEASEEEWQDDTMAAFAAWFEEIRGQLDEDAAGHLQNEIDDLQADLDSIIQYSAFTVELDGDEFVLFWHGVEDECPFTTELVGTDYALNFTYQDSNIL